MTMTGNQQAPLGSGFGNRTTAADILKDVGLEGRNVIVTGGYSGIGIEAVRRSPKRAHRSWFRRGGQTRRAKS